VLAGELGEIPAMPGVNPFDDSPYRPPVTSGMASVSPPACASASAAQHVQEQWRWRQWRWRR
jgi:hypothetical protein